MLADLHLQCFAVVEGRRHLRLEKVGTAFVFEKQMPSPSSRVILFGGTSSSGKIYLELCLYIMYAPRILSIVLLL